MKKLLVLASLCACTARVLAFPSFDPFADASASGGTHYNTGETLAGQTNALGDRWVAITTTGTAAAPIFTPYTFGTYSNLPAPTGTEALQVVAPTSGTGPGARIEISSTGISNGTVYVSMLLKCPTVNNMAVATTGALGGGIFSMSFSSDTGVIAGSPASQGGRWYFRQSAANDGTYNIGVSKVTSPTGGSSNPTAYWDSRNFTTDQELFVVVGYQFNQAATNDDVVKLWINPDPTTLGQSTEPATTVSGGTSPADVDLTTIKSFNIMARNAKQPGLMYCDEIRTGTNWAQVTAALAAPVVVPTLSVSQQDANTVLLSWGTNSQNFTLQSAIQLLNTNTAWSAVSGSPTISGTNYQQTDTINPTTPKFYRLLH